MDFWSRIGDSFEGLNHAPVDNTMRYGDNHGETTTKAFIAAALLYALGGAGGGEAAGGGGGGISTGGAVGTFGKQGIGILGNAMNGLGGGGGGGDTTMQKRRGILQQQPDQPLFNFGNDDMIDPTTTNWLRRSALG